MSYRSKLNIIDASSFVSPTTTEVGAMVINSSKGVYKYCQSPADVLNVFGNPSADYPEVFEALAFTTAAPCYIFAAIHSDALYGGIDVSLSGVTSYAVGRNPATFNWTGYPTISHTFFAASPYTDNLQAIVTYVGGTSGFQFQLQLYKILSTGSSLITTYNYSLIREKDGFGRSLYYADVFKDNDYVTPSVNPNFTNTNYVNMASGLTANFSGGTRGSSPTTSDYTTAWGNFQYKSKYPVKIFMDVNGNSTATVNNIIKNYQPYAEGLSVIPMGNTANAAIVYKNALGIDSVHMAMYTNWAQIVDNYNNSYAWISDIGSVGAKWALMEDVYDAEAPAGIDEVRGNSHGGQLSNWSYVKAEQSYTDTDLSNMDTSQINPIIINEVYGRMVYGNRTMQITNSSQSFIGTERLYKYIEKAINTQVLPPQLFRQIDAAHMNKAKVLTDNFLAPIQSAGYLNDYYTVCDTSNNTGNTMNLRQFILTVYLQATPDAEFTVLNVVVTSNATSIQSLIK